MIFACRLLQLTAIACLAGCTTYYHDIPATQPGALIVLQKAGSPGGTPGGADIQLDTINGLAAQNIAWKNNNYRIAAGRTTLDVVAVELLDYGVCTLEFAAAAEAVYTLKVSSIANGRYTIAALDNAGGPVATCSAERLKRRKIYVPW